MMKFNPKSFFAKMLISHLTIILISLIVLGIIFGYLVFNYYSGLKEWEATNNSQRIASLVSQSISNDNLTPHTIKMSKNKIDTISQSTNMEIGIINSSGQFLFKSSNIRKFNLPMESVEIEDMLKGNKITKKILGPDDNYLLMIFPLVKESNNIVMGPAKSHDKKIVGGIIVQTPLDSINTTVNNIIKFIIFSFAITLVAAIIISIPFARHVTKPIEAIKTSALKIARGKYEKVKLPLNSSEEIKHLVKTFNYAVDQIEDTIHKKNRLEKTQKEFVANVSHEFRAPLTSIKGFLELILEQNLNIKEIKEYTSIMYKDAEYIEHLLSDLLILSNLESGNLPINKETVSVKHLINRALNSLQNKLKDKKLTVNTKIEKHLTDIYVDKNRIHQVLINLLENAIRYSSPGEGITIKANKIYTKDYINRVKFSIIDEGCGIPEEKLNKIWNRFYKTNTAHTRDKQKSSGLGLAIVKEIIQLHEGVIEVENNKGAGVTFTFII